MQQKPQDVIAAAAGMDGGLTEEQEARILRAMFDQRARSTNRYYRGPCKKIRKRADVVAKRKAAKAARKVNAKCKHRGQKSVKGKRFTRQ